MVVCCCLLLGLVGGCWAVVSECRGHSDVRATEPNLILNNVYIVGYLSPFLVIVRVFGWLFVVVCCCAW